MKSVESLPEYQKHASGWLGDGSIPPLDYADLTNAAPALPARPSLPHLMSTASNISIKERAASVPQIAPPLGPPPLLPVPSTHTSRSPSPDHGRKTMRTTLRPEKRGFRSSRSAQKVPQRPAPMKAAGMAWGTMPNKQFGQLESSRVGSYH